MLKINFKKTTTDIGFLTELSDCLTGGGGIWVWESVLTFDGKSEEGGGITTFDKNTKGVLIFDKFSDFTMKKGAGTNF